MGNQHHQRRVARLEETRIEKQKLAAPTRWIRLLNDQPIPAGHEKSNVIRRIILNRDGSVCPLDKLDIPDPSPRHHRHAEEK
jgi:hypothetical protein